MSREYTRRPGSGRKPIPNRRRPSLYATLFCSRRYDSTGNGSFCKTVPLRQFTDKPLNQVTDEEYAAAIAKAKDHIAVMREEQRAKNREYRTIAPAGSSMEGRRLRAELNAATGNDDLPRKLQEATNLRLERTITHSPTLPIHIDRGTGNTFALLGSSKRGKSTLMMELIRRAFLNENYITTLISINAQALVYDRPEPEYKRMLSIPYFDSRVEYYISAQKQVNMVMKNRYNFCNIFDDVIAARNSSLVNELVLTYRNSNMSSILCFQYPFLLTKMLRSNVNNIYLFGFNSDESIEDIIKIYLRSHFIKMMGGRPTMEDMIAYYKLITKNHGFIYMHPESDSVSVHRLNIGSDEGIDEVEPGRSAAARQDKEDKEDKEKDKDKDNEDPVKA